MCLFSSSCQYVSQNKEADNDWFRLESTKDGTRWFGKCWYVHDLLKYEFDVEFDVSYKNIPLYQCWFNTSTENRQKFSTIDT